MSLNFLEKVRLEIGDTEIREGILPGGEHFSDSQIAYGAETEGVADYTAPNPSMYAIGRTSARMLEIAAVHWSSQPEEVELGPAMEKGRQSELLGRRAKIFRDKWGWGGDENTGNYSKSRLAPAYSGSGMSPYSPGVN